MAYIDPLPPPPINDNDLEDVLTALVSGITGIAGELVRPRWQPEPPDQPDFAVDWASIGITATEPDAFSYQEQIDASTVQLEQDEKLTVLLSCYGPNAQAMMSRFQQGIQMERNREVLAPLFLKFLSGTTARQVPALLKDRWVKRFDSNLFFSRRIKRRYTVAAIEGGSMGLNNELYTTNLLITPPTP